MAPHAANLHAQKSAAPPPEVSILVLTHNARRYVRKTLASLRRTTGVSYEVVVVDNASGSVLRHLLAHWQRRGWINRLALLDYNSLFAEGNNIAARMASRGSKYYLLLNSDVEVKSDDWLRRLIDAHRRGITAYGIVEGRPITRVDGYCMLIDRDLYDRHTLDEAHQWWWAVSKLQAKLLLEGHAVQGYLNHESWLHHFGGKSGDGFKGGKGMNVDLKEVAGWFGGKSIRVLDAR